MTRSRQEVNQARDSAQDNPQEYKIAWEYDLILREGDPAKTMKASNKISRTIKRVHGKKKMEDKPSNKNAKEPATDPTT